MSMKIELTDSHTHLYLDTFNDDLNEVIERALAKGVTKMLLPNIDSTSINQLLAVCEKYSENCFPMMGLHPTSVRKDYNLELEAVYNQLKQNSYIAIGEIGLDLYWDKTFLKEQQFVFRRQLQWAKKYDLPVVIHSREAFDEIFKIMDEEISPELKGVFHSFSGNYKQVEKILSYNFYLGINGIVTFKNSGLDEVVKKIPLESLLIETDAPYLAPVPFRGIRNESAYIKKVAEKIASIKQTDLSVIAAITTKNALNLFDRIR